MTPPPASPAGALHAIQDPHTRHAHREPPRRRVTGVPCADGSPWRHLSRSRARTEVRGESAWPGQAAHPAGSYKYTALSANVFTARASKDDINISVDFDINISVRHHGVFSGSFPLSEDKSLSPSQGTCLCYLVRSFPSSLATYEHPHPHTALHGFAVLS